MLLHSQLAIFLAGFVGGLVGEFITLYEQSRRGKLEPRTKVYWLFSILMAVMGGVLAIMYGYKELHVFGAAYLGASAPVVLKQGFSSFAPPAQLPIK